MKRAKNNKIEIFAVSALVLFLLFTFVAKADYSFRQRIADVAGKVLGDALVGILVDDEEKLGGFTDMYLPHTCINDVCTYHLSGTCPAASTTLLSFKNPSPATATLTYFRLDIDGVATSTAKFYVGTSSTSYIASTNTTFDTALAAKVIDGATYATNTQALYIMGMGDGDMGGSASSTGTGGEDMVIMGPSEYIVGIATSTGGTNELIDWTSNRFLNKGFIGNTETFDCEWTAIITE